MNHPNSCPGYTDGVCGAGASCADCENGSPCIDVCRMDEVTGWCEGCFRTLDEIAAWGQLDAVGRRSVLAQLPARRAGWELRRYFEIKPADGDESAP